MPRVLLVIAALLPGAWFAWRWQTMPHVSGYHDDGVYFVTAKAFAERGEMRIESLPGDPYQTKYPPLWPAVLSAAWKWEPRFPDNLRYAMALCWLWLPLSAAGMWVWLGKANASPWAQAILTAFFCANPYVILFSTTLLSEMLFETLLLCALLALAGKSPKAAALAGLCAALALLTRTSGITLLPAALYVFARRRQWRHAVLFLAMFLPVLGGWFWWSKAYRMATTEPALLYYTDYAGFHALTFHWPQAYLYAWRNLDGMIHGLGSFLLPDITMSLLEKVIALTLGIAGLKGAFQMARRDWDSPVATYGVLAAAHIGMLLLWEFPLGERFMLPVLPLWLAGLWTEIAGLTAGIRKVLGKKDFGQKVAAAAMAAAGAWLAWTCVDRQRMLLFQTLPDFYASHQRRLEESEQAMRWIRDNVPADAGILSENDPKIYLRTGRPGKGLTQMINTVHWYRDDLATRRAEYARAAEHAKATNLKYLVIHDSDFSRDMIPEEFERIQAAIKQDPRLERVHQSGDTAVYRIR